METLEEKLKQFKHTKAVGDGYPRGYKSHINAFMEGFNSGRFNSYKDEYFVETRQYANEQLAEYNKKIKENWKEARCQVVARILQIEEKERLNRLLYGNSLNNQKEEALKRVLEFVCESLPVLKEGE